MRSWKLTSAMLILISVTVSTPLYGQYRVVTEEEWLVITKALTIGKTAIQEIEDLEEKIKLYETSLRNLQDAKNLERMAHLETKKTLLDRMRALAQYRIRKRPWQLKLLGLYIFIRDKHDRELEGQIKELEKELEAWK